MKKFIINLIALLGRMIYLPITAYYRPTGEEKSKISGIILTDDPGLIRHLAEYRKEEPFKP
ncbi:MAG TPA: hypothetical protein ENI23_10650 [bacterium]|nr:hypothetical protein [bacterium]